MWAELKGFIIPAILNTCSKKLLLCFFQELNIRWYKNYRKTRKRWRNWNLEQNFVSLIFLECQCCRKITCSYFLIFFISSFFLSKNLQRHVMSYIITYYLPSGLFVVVSWISFLIPPDIVPGKKFLALIYDYISKTLDIYKNESFKHYCYW